MKAVLGKQKETGVKKTCDVFALPAPEAPPDVMMALEDEPKPEEAGASKSESEKEDEKSDQNSKDSKSDSEKRSSDHSDSEESEAEDKSSKNEADKKSESEAEGKSLKNEGDKKSKSSKSNSEDSDGEDGGSKSCSEMGYDTEPEGETLENLYKNLKDQCEKLKTEKVILNKHCGEVEDHMASMEQQYNEEEEANSQLRTDKRALLKRNRVLAFSLARKKLVVKVLKRKLASKGD